MAGGFIGGFNPLNEDPIEYSGIWNLKEQVQAIAAGRWTGIPLPEIYTWGDNGSGRLGDGTVIDKSSPVQVGALTDWAQVSAADGNLGDFTLAVKTDGTLWSWGENGGGMLGDGTTVDKSSPIQVGSLTDWYQVAAGRDHSIAVKTDGTLWAWGAGTFGMLGDGTVVAKNSPVQIGALTNWSKISAGTFNTAAIKTDGTLWAWGLGTAGTLGQNDIISRSSPVQVGALTDWKQVSTNTTAIMAVKTDGTLWGWGANTQGQLGDGTTTSRSSPVQIGALTDWLQVSVSGGGSPAPMWTLAVKTDGTLWAWGSGTTYGALGTNNTSSYLSPVQVGALTNWASVDAGRQHSAATKTDGTLWTWGGNGFGQLGDGTTANKSSPIQVGSLGNWSQVSAGALHTAAILNSTTN